jgi:hypothetical protein
MRTLTLHLKVCSAVTIVTGVERDFADSGEHLRRETTKFAQLRAPLPDSLHQNDSQAPALLPIYPTASGMALIDDDEIWPELGFRLLGEMGEREREKVRL